MCWKLCLIFHKQSFNGHVLSSIRLTTVIFTGMETDGKYTFMCRKSPRPSQHQTDPWQKVQNVMKSSAKETPASIFVQEQPLCAAWGGQQT